MARFRPVKSAAWPWLAAQMNARELTRQAVATKSGYSPATVSRWLNGKQKPDENAKPGIGTALGIKPETVELPIDAKSTEVARKSPKVTSERATDEVLTSHVTPPVQTPGGEQEGALDDYAAMTFYLMKGLPPSEQRAKYDAFRRLIHPATEHAPPQPAAGRSVLRRRRK